METKVNYTTVGAFVIVLISAIVFIIVWLSSGLRTKEVSSYAIIMNEPVTGLNIDSPVKYNGVDVGAVKKIELRRSNPKQVFILVDIYVGTPITQGTTATLSVQGLTGIAYLSLQGSDTNLAPLEAESGHRYPVIRSTPSFLLRLDTAIQDLTTNINKITASVQELLNPENQKAIQATLKSLDTISLQLAKSSKNFPNTMQTFSQQTLPDTNKLLNNLNTLTIDLLETSSNIKQNPAILFRGQTPPPLGPGEK